MVGRKARIFSSAMYISWWIRTSTASSPHVDFHSTSAAKALLAVDLAARQKLGHCLCSVLALVAQSQRKALTDRYIALNGFLPIEKINEANNDFWR